MMPLQRPTKAQRKAYRAVLYGLRHLLNDERVNMIRCAVMDDDTEVLVHLDSAEFLTGAISYSIRQNEVRIHALGSLEAGVGSSLMEAVENVATGLDLPVTLLSTRGVEGFYEKRGFETLNDAGEMSKPAVRDRSKLCGRMPQIEFQLDSNIVRNPHHSSIAQSVERRTVNPSGEL